MTGTPKQGFHTPLHLWCFLRVSSQPDFSIVQRLIVVEIGSERHLH